jgi:hypothetical protein
MGSPSIRSRSLFGYLVAPCWQTTSRQDTASRMRAGGPVTSKFLLAAVLSISAREWAKFWMVLDIRRS